MKRSISVGTAVGVSILGILICVTSIFADILRGRQLSDIGSIQKFGAAFSLLLILVIWCVYSSGFFSAVRIVLRSLALIAFGMGMTLFLINITGLFISMRNDKVYDGIDAYDKARIPRYSAKETARLKNQYRDETVEQYVRRLTKLVHESTVHFWEPEQYPEFNYRVPIYENYILWYMGREYEFCNPDKAVDRAVTACGQVSMIVMQFLRANDIPAHRVTLNGHTVTEALIDKSKRTWWVLDADFGVVIDHNVKALSKNPELAERYYKAAGYSAQRAKWVSDFYTPNGNYVITDYHQCHLEEQRYRLKWQIPAFLVLPYPLIILALKYFSGHRRLPSN